MSDIDQRKIRQLDFTLLLILRALLRHRRTTAVAAELGLSQSAVSHALARLRRIFGDPLFTRRPHGLEPTRHALALTPRIDALLRNAGAALGASAAFDPAAATRDFRIAAADHVGALLAAPLLAAFQQKAPGARFALRISLGAEALQLLRRDEIDLAIGQFQRPLDEFTVTTLYTDRYHLVARSRHPLIKRQITKTLFEKLQHVTVSVSGDYRSFTDDDLRQLGVARRIAATVPRFSTAFDVVSRSDAIALAPLRYARAQASAYKLVLYEPPFAIRPMRIVAVRRNHADTGINWLCDEIAGAVGTRG